jgi:hypothetical protein
VKKTTAHSQNILHGDTDSFRIRYRTFFHLKKNRLKSSGLGHVIFLLIYFRFGSHNFEDFEVP